MLFRSVAGFADGSVGLMSEDGTLLEQSASFGDQPSALQALQNGDHIDVYLTLDGSQVPVFVSLLIPVLTELPNSGAVAQATGVAGADLVLVATLLTGGLEEARPLDAEVATNEATFVLFLPPVRVAVPQGAGQADEVENVAVALVVKADPNGGPTTAEFQQRVQDALAERLSRQQVYDSVEDLVEAIRGVLEQFRAPAPKSETDGVPESLFEEVALERVAEALVSVSRDEGGVGPSRADLPWLSDPAGEPDSLLSLQSALLGAWLCSAPEPGATGRFGSPRPCTRGRGVRGEVILPLA